MSDKSGLFGPPGFNVSKANSRLTRGIVPQI